MSTSKTSGATPYLMAVLCLGLLSVSLIQDLFFEGTLQRTPTESVIIKVMQFGIPVLLGILLCTGRRWAMMVGVVYGTIGMALDIATFVQSVTGETDTAGYLLLVVASGILNFLLVLLGGRGILTNTLQ